MSAGRRFDVRELAGADDPGADADLGQAELGQALSAARAIEAALSEPEPITAPDLADRIMAAVAREPAPHALGILRALRRRPGLGGFIDSLRVAWDRAFRGAGRPIGLRAGAFAYVAAVAVLALSLSGVAAVTTAGALGLFGPPASQRPDATVGPPTTGPLETPGPTDERSAEPSESPEPSESAEPSESPEPSDDHGTSAGGSGEQPGATAEPGDDHGGESSDSASATQTPQPTKTLEPGETPKPTKSAEGASSDG
jgi:hypothetical protein